jgi:cellobiose phosphorylase
MVKVFIDASKKRDNMTTKRPPNFRGTDGNKAEASCEIRVRNWNSVLEPEETAILDRHKIPYGTRVTKQEGYFVNPKHYALVEKMKGLPEDFLLYQEEESVPVATTESVEAVFAKGLADKLLDIVATLAIKAQYKGTLAEALEEAKQFVVAAEESQKLAEEKEKEEAAKKAAKEKAKRDAKKAKAA